MGKGENYGPCKVLDLLFSPSLFFHCLPLDDMVGLSPLTWMKRTLSPIDYRQNNIPSNHFFRKVSRMKKENWGRKEEKEMMIAFDGDNSRSGMWRHGWMVCVRADKPRFPVIVLILWCFSIFEMEESSPCLMYRWSPLATLHVCRHDCESHTYDCSFSLLMIMVNYTTFVTVDDVTHKDSHCMTEKFICVVTYEWFLFP